MTIREVPPEITPPSHPLRRHIKLGAASCALVVLPFAATETNTGDTPLKHDCQVTVTDKTKVAVDNLLDEPMAPRVTADSYETPQLQNYLAYQAGFYGLQVFSPDNTLEKIAENNQTMSKDKAALANFSAANAFLHNYDVELNMPNSALEGTMLFRSFKPAKATDVSSRTVQDILPRIVRAFSYMPVEYVKDVAKLDKVSFVKPLSDKNFTVAYADEIQATGERAVYINTTAPPEIVANGVDNLIQHEVAHHTIAAICKMSLRGTRHDSQFSAENPDLPYTQDTSVYSAQQSARGARRHKPKAPDAHVNFVSRYAGTTEGENRAELVSYITTPPYFNTGTSKRFPKVRKQAAHMLGLLYQTNPKITAYFIAVGNRK